MGNVRHGGVRSTGGLTPIKGRAKTCLSALLDLGLQSAYSLSTRPARESPGVFANLEMFSMLGPILIFVGLVAFAVLSMVFGADSRGLDPNARDLMPNI